MDLVADERTLREVRALGTLFCTVDEAASVFGVNRQAFVGFLERVPEAREAWDTGLNNARASLRRKQFKLADTSAAMAIFLGKNYLDQRDVPRERVPETKEKAADKGVGELSIEEQIELERLLSRIAANTGSAPQVDGGEESGSVHPPRMAMDR